MRTKKRIRLKGRLRIYMQTSLYMGILLLIVDIGTYFLDVRAGFLLTCFLLFYFGMIILLMFYNRPIILNELISFATQYGQVQKTLLRDMAIPYALLDETGRVIWCNDAFRAAIHSEKGFHKSITYVFPAITRERLPQGEQEAEIEISFEESDYIAHITRVSLRGMISEDSDVLDDEDYDSCLYAMYLYDETALKLALRENDAQSLAVGLIYLDNYEEALASVEEVRRSLLKALIDRKVNKYISSFDGICQNIEKDKYLVILKKKSVMQMQEQRFELLEDVKTVNIGNEMAVTLSIGIGANGESYTQNYEYARMSIDLALGRGGDQVVVRDGEDITYYGGKTQQVERNTRVKARVKAHALREIIESREHVIIMGHSISDVDSLGAAIGIYCAAKVLGKKAQIVLNEITSSLRPLVECFTEEKGYPADLFIKNEEALMLTNENTLVVVVDVNRPSYTECPELLKCTQTVCVFDHHRQTNEVIENPVLSYVEPYASSACEMIAEVLQYFSENIRLAPCEADCIYAGILIDTNNFMTKTGVRTFEAAAYLRRAGAEVTRVRKMLRNDMAAYKARAEAVRHAEVYRGAFAISICPADEVESPTIVCAQAANELLNIVGIKASFVLTEYQGKIYVSSRSIDEINVQLIMERLGGGGHLNVAGAQLTNCSLQQAKHIIQDTIDEMLKEGDISE